MFQIRELPLAFGPVSEKTVMVFGKQLKSNLKANNMSVAQLSSASKISSKTIYHYFEGRSPRNLNHTLKPCEVLNVTSDFLLFGNDPIAKSDQLVEFGTYDVFLRKRNK